MNLLFRIGVYIPVLLLVAIVVVGQQHASAKATMSAAKGRALRWLVWSFVLVAVMELLGVLFIGW